MKLTFTDVLRIEALAHAGKCRVYYQPLNIELGMIHYVGGDWRAYSYEGTQIPGFFPSTREAALAVLTAWLQKVVAAKPRVAQFSDN